MKSKLAIASLIISLVTLIVVILAIFSPVLEYSFLSQVVFVIFMTGGIIGIALSWLSLYNINKYSLEGRKIAIAALIISIINLVIIPVIGGISIGGALQTG